MHAITRRPAAMFPFSVNCCAPTVQTMNVTRVPPEPQRKNVRRLNVFMRKQQMIEIMYDQSVTMPLISVLSNSESSPVCFNIGLR